jgi:hypothetical protein
MSSRYLADKKANRSTGTANKTKGRRLAWAGVLVLFAAVIVAQYQSSQALAIIGAGVFMLGTALLITKQRGRRVLICVGAATAIMGIIFALQG